MTSRYAADTSVPVDRSRVEIERTLQRYGATSFVYGWDQEQAVIGFVIRDRQIRFQLPLPDRTDPTITRTPTGRPRSATQAAEAWEQRQRAAWRALALVVKAKLEAVAAGIVTFDEEFGMHFVLADGRTVAEVVLPQLDDRQLTAPTIRLALGSGR